LISSVSHLVSTSYIHAYGNIKVVPTHYTILTAQPSTGKTPAMEFSKKAIFAIEQKNMVTTQFSAVFNGPSMGIIDLMSTLPKPSILSKSKYIIFLYYVCLIIL